MKRIAFFAVFLLTICKPTIGNAQAVSSTTDKIKQLVSETKSRYAPDARTKIVALTKEDEENKRYVIETTESDAREYLLQHIGSLPARIDIVTLPDSSVGDNVHGIINLSVSNLRTAPGHSSEMATQLLLGTQVDILQYRRSEYRVRTPEGYIAWVPNSSVVAMDSVTLDQWKAKDKIIYTEEFGRSYSSPDRSGLRVSDLVYGNILALDKVHADHYEVSYPDNRKAFVPKTEATTFDQWLSTRNATAENILSSAKSMLGLPYLWGGTSVKGVDCSGFTKTSFYMNGYVIPRDASQQVLAGDAVDILDENGRYDQDKALRNLKPADLLFFAGGSTPRITHVALYIGNGEFIHSAGTVRINSIFPDADNYDDFQTRTLVSARRYIGSQDQQIQAINNHPFYKNTDHVN